MKILIVSDTHKKNENYFKVLEMHHPDMVIHCGDAEGSEYALSSAAECPVYIVLGNNDFFSDLPREITLDIGSYKVWVTHGHNYYVSMGNETIKKEAIDRGVYKVVRIQRQRQSLTLPMRKPVSFTRSTEAVLNMLPPLQPAETLF